MRTPATSTPEQIIALTSSVGETLARETAEHEWADRQPGRGQRFISSELLKHFALALFSERIHLEPRQMRLGDGPDFDPVLSRLATWCCPSDSEPVALALTINGTGCSCLPNHPTPTASDWKGSTGLGSRRGTLAERIAMEESSGGSTVYPHPELVEHLMGFPIGWSELSG